MDVLTGADSHLAKRQSLLARFEIRNGAEKPVQLTHVANRDVGYCTEIFRCNRTDQEKKGHGFDNDLTCIVPNSSLEEKERVP